MRTLIFIILSFLSVTAKAELKTSADYVGRAQTALKFTMPANFEVGTIDPFGRTQIWNHAANASLRLGSLASDGDPTTSSSEGSVMYGQNAQGDPMTSADFGYARVKPMRFGLYNSKASIANYIFKVDNVSLYLADDTFVKKFEVTRATGAIKTSLGAGVVESDVSGNLTASTQYLKKGALSIFVIDNGEYATGQAAIDAAPAGSVLFFGPKVGTWGNITLKPDVDIVGLGAPGSTNIVFQSITFSPTTGNVSQNTVFVSNISASVASGSSTVVIGGTAPSRVRLDGCTFYKTAGTEDAISITNNQATSSVYITNSQLNGTGSTGSLINTVSPFLKVVNVTFDGANKALTQTAGLTTLDKADIEYAQTASIIDVVAGSVISADSLFRNLGTNSVGVNVSVGATFAIDQATFDISAGTGYAVNGLGVLAYGRVTFADIPIINPRNVKFQSTLTIANYTLTPTLAP